MSGGILIVDQVDTVLLEQQRRSLEALVARVESCGTLEDEASVTGPLREAMIWPDEWDALQGICNMLNRWSDERAGEIRMQRGEPSGLFLNYYRCPDCGNEWEDEYECQVDDDCGECGARHISPYESEDVE